MAINSGSHTGTITVEQDNFPTFTEVATMESGVSGIYRPFYNVSSSASNKKEYFEKVFVKNNSTTNDFLNMVIKESGELGFSNRIFFDLASSGSDSGASSNNRLGPPPSTQLLESDTGILNDNDKNVVGTNLIAGSGQGIWMRLLLTTALAADSGQYIFQFDGSTTN